MTAQPFELSVEAGKVREFARSVRSADPEHLGPDPVSSPTFLMTAVWWQDEKSSPLDKNRDLKRVLHGEQGFTFFGEPPSAGDQLTGQARVERTYTKAGRRGGEMTFTEIVTSYTDTLSGRLVAEVKQTLISTERPPEDAK